jgi:Ca-activated chloride channel family protein
MKEEALSFGLTAGFGQDAPALVGVAANGRLDGPILQMRWCQRYRNPHREPLEVVYTFPLPAGAVLLEFSSELQGRKQVARVVERSNGEAQYEKALEAGDAPVLLESRPDGLHTANIGNLAPGEEIVLEIRFALVLVPEQGRLRVAFPCTIAPRYGNPAAAGIEPQQVPLASLAASYDLELAFVLGPTHAGTRVECPTHRIERRAEGGTEFALEKGVAWLDRDVVFLLTPDEAGRSVLLLGEDPTDPATPVVALAALVPPPQPGRERIVAKLLVDCSGSMAGDSIASATRALRGALQALREGDEVSLTCFGSEVQHRCALGPLTPARRERLVHAIGGIRADLGGTEMDSALRAVYALGSGKAEDGLRDVLLVTDGEVWQADAMIEAARAGGHRIFAIGVGSAPAEGVLRELAEATGGACEFATPGEALEAAAARMLARMLQRPWRDMLVQWDGAEPQWQTALPASGFGGDAVLVCAGFAPGAARQRAVRLVGTGGSTGAGTLLAQAVAASSPLGGDTLARIAGAHRLARIADPAHDEALALALRYQIPCAHTVSVLVHERAAEDKVTQPAQLHRVPSMLAAGYGATSTVSFAVSYADAMPLGALAAAEPIAARAMAHLHSPSVMRRSAPVMSRVDPLAFVDDSEPPAPPPPPAAGPATLGELAQAVAEAVRAGRIEALPGLVHRLIHEIPPMSGALLELERAGIDRGTAVLLIAHWVNSRAGGVGDAAIAAALAPHVAQQDAAEVAMGFDCFERRLGTRAVRDWAAPQPPAPAPNSRARRLAAALRLGRRDP